MPKFGGLRRRSFGGPRLGEFSRGNWMASRANRWLTPAASFEPGARSLAGARVPTLQLLRPPHGGKGGRGPPGRRPPAEDSYLVDSASSHMLVSKIKPCMSKYKQLYGETANGSLNQLSFI